MSIIEFILGLVVLAASLVVSCACYIVKNEKGGLNAALGGASDFMTTRRNDNNLKVNKFVVKVGAVLTIAILALTIIGAHFLRRNAVKKNEIRSIPAKVADTLHPSNVTWLSAKETTKRTGEILCVVAASAAFMMLADTLFGAMLKFAI